MQTGIGAVVVCAMFVAFGIVAPAQNASADPASPANDLFSAARHLAPAGAVNGTVFGASLQDGEAPSPDADSARTYDGSVWYSYLAPQTGTFDLRLRSVCSDPDLIRGGEPNPVLLTIYQGSTLASLVSLGNVMTEHCDVQRVITQAVVAGQRYSLRVIGGANIPFETHNVADFALSWSTTGTTTDPPNQTRATAIALPGRQGSAVATGTTTNVLWYTLPTDRSGMLIADTCGSSHGTTLTLVRGSHSVTATGTEQCNVVYDLTANAPYAIRVHVTGPTSTAVLNWRLAGTTPCVKVAGCVTVARTRFDTHTEFVRHAPNFVVPTVACETLDRTHGRRTIALGYTARMPAESPTDGHNYFLLDAAGQTSRVAATDLGQPSSFSSGSPRAGEPTPLPHPTVFTVTVPIAAEVTWIVRSTAEGRNELSNEFEAHDQYEARLQTGHPHTCATPPPRWATVQSNSSAFISTVFRNDAHDPNSGALTAVSLQFGVGLDDASGYLASRCATGGHPLAPELLFGYDDRAPNHLTQSLPGGSNVVPLPAGQVVRTDADGFVRSHTARRKIADPQRPPKTFMFGTTGLGLVWVDVLVDVIGKCDYNGQIVRSAYPMWVLANGLYTQWVVVTDPGTQTLRTENGTELPDDAPIGGGMRFR